MQRNTRNDTTIRSNGYNSEAVIIEAGHRTDELIRLGVDLDAFADHVKVGLDVQAFMLAVRNGFSVESFNYQPCGENCDWLNHELGEFNLHANFDFEAGLPVNDGEGCEVEEFDDAELLFDEGLFGIDDNDDTARRMRRADQILRQDREQRLQRRYAGPISAFNARFPAEGGVLFVA